MHPCKQFISIAYFRYRIKNTSSLEAKFRKKELHEGTARVVVIKLNEDKDC